MPGIMYSPGGSLTIRVGGERFDENFPRGLQAPPRGGLCDLSVFLMSCAEDCGIDSKWGGCMHVEKGEECGLHGGLKLEMHDSKVSRA